MKLKKIYSLLLFSIMGMGNQAFATSWGDFSAQDDLINITSANFNSATVLRKVSVVCPRDGFLKASANAGFSLRAVSTGAKVWVRYSIRLSSNPGSGIDPAHYRNVQQFVMDPVHSTPGSMFRVDRCQAGEKVGYEFVAQRVQNAQANTAAWQPRLFVEFYSNKI